MDTLMNLLWLFAIALVIAICVRGLWINSQLKVSTYSQVSGNTLRNLLFNKGNYGEFLTYRILEQCGENKLLCNVYLPKSNGETTEVDLISINNKGIFVYESKNYSGWIFGDEKNKNWTQCLEGGKKYKFFNPISQNKGHIKAIDNCLDNEYTGCLYSYIIFSERCELKKITVTSKNIKVIKRYDLKKSLTKHKLNLPDVLSDEQINKIYDKLKVGILADKDVKQRHIENIKARLQ